MYPTIGCLPFDKPRRASLRRILVQVNTNGRLSSQFLGSEDVHANITSKISITSASHCNESEDIYAVVPDCAGNWQARARFPIDSSHRSYEMEDGISLFGGQDPTISHLDRAKYMFTSFPAS